jgi:N utilization substance protein A
MAGGIPTVERLGSMTPEELEAIEGIDSAAIEALQSAVNSYYGQFEASVAQETQPESESAAAEPQEAAEPENESVRIENTEHPAPSEAS